MMDVFERERATKALAGISEAALTMLDHEATPLDDFLSAFRRSALSRLFSAALRLSSFEQAQNAMLRMENREWYVRIPVSWFPCLTLCILQAPGLLAPVCDGGLRAEGVWLADRVCVW